MRITSSDLISILDVKIGKEEKLIWNRIGENHCWILFPEDKEKDILISIRKEIENDFVTISCKTKHRLPINICLILLKEGLSIRCIGRKENGEDEVIFDSTVDDFCEFIKNLQNIADDLNFTLCLGNNPLRDYEKGPLFVRMRDVDCRSKLVGFLTNPERTFQVTLFDKSISLAHLLSRIDRTQYRLIVRETIPTSTGRKVTTIYDSFYEKVSSK